MQILSRPSNNLKKSFLESKYLIWFLVQNCRTLSTNPLSCNRELCKEGNVAGTLKTISSRSLTRVDENGSGDIDISLGYRRHGRISSSLRSYKTDTPKYNRYMLRTQSEDWTTHGLTDHSRTHGLDDIGQFLLYAGKWLQIWPAGVHRCVYIALARVNDAVVRGSLLWRTLPHRKTSRNRRKNLDQSSSNMPYDVSPRKGVLRFV